MEKSKVLEAYYRGLLSLNECSQVLGVSADELLERSQQNEKHVLKSQTNKAIRLV
jgi:hypothetical protein